MKRLILLLFCASLPLGALNVPVAGDLQGPAEETLAVPEEGLLEFPSAGPENPGGGQGGKKNKNLLVDVALVSAAVCAYVLIIPDTRRRIFREASIAKVWENFKRPFWSAGEGGRRDHNGFWINCVGHPLSYAALGLYLQERGYNNLETLAFTQTVNVVWEYGIEGSMWLPSSKDLLADLCGSLAAVYVLAPLSDLGESKLAAGDRRWGNVLLYYLNPFKKLNRLIFGSRLKASGIYLVPARGGFVCGLRWTV